MLRIRRSPTGQEILGIGKLDSSKCQSGPSGFPGNSHNSWSLARARGADGWIFYLSIREQSGEDRAKG
jgi:hypothetical protein